MDVGGGVGGGSAEGTRSVETLQFAEYEQRFDTLCETGAADPNAPSGTSRAAIVIGVGGLVQLMEIKTSKINECSFGCRASASICIYLLVLGVVLMYIDLCCFMFVDVCEFAAYIFCQYFGATCQFGVPFGRPLESKGVRK